MCTVAHFLGPVHRKTKILSILLINYLNSLIKRYRYGSGCGSQMFIPDLIFLSRIPDPDVSPFRIPGPDVSPSRIPLDPDFSASRIPPDPDPQLDIVLSSIYYCRCIQKAYYKMVPVPLWGHVQYRTSS
jgi:hypothetical protein